MNPDFTGRGLGALETTMLDKLEEVARLVTIGYKPGEIGKQVGVGTVRASQLVREAKKRGLVELLQAERNRVTRKMEETRVKLAEEAFKVLQKRLAFAASQDGEAIKPRDIKDALSALAKTEHTAEFQKAQLQQAPVQVAIFNQADIKRAEGESKVIFGD